MLLRQNLTVYLEELLQTAQFKDYCPNGLQVAGVQEIKCIVTGVTACQALLDAAVDQQADAVIVHHGYFWKGEDPCIIGIKQSRLKTLLAHDINLFAYHLPLDLHSKLGNNVQLARQLDWEITAELPMVQSPSYGLIGQLKHSMSAQQLSTHLASVLGQNPVHIAGHRRELKAIAWCTGAAQDLIEDAARAGVDAYISGEISERTVHVARELGIDYFAAGHHATERYGIQALTQHLSQQFAEAIDSIQFIEVANPV